MINGSSSMKVFKKIKSLWSCLEICESNNKCHYVEYYHSTQNCQLFDKKTHFNLVSTNESIEIDFYQRRIYSHKILYGIHITNERFRKVEKIADSFSCWEECLKEEICEMVTYQYSTRFCYLIKGLTTGSIKFIDDTDYTSITYENVDQKQFRSVLNLADYTLYNKTQISGFYLHLSVESKELCLKECFKRKDVCIAISFGENRCHLVKKGEYKLRRFNNWSTVYLDKKAPIQMKKKPTNRFSKM